MKYPHYDLFTRMGKTVLSKKWVFAKTMPKAPHWYTLLKDWANPEEFYEHDWAQIRGTVK